MYNPAGNLTTSTGFNHLATVYYDRTALDVLRTKFMFWEMVDDRVISRQNGKTIQFYRYGTFAANTTAKTEGDVGTSLQLSTATLSATLSQFTDFISVSDLLTETAIDPVLENAAMELGYRAGLTADTLVRNEIDSSAGNVALLGANLQAKDLADVRHLLAGVNVQPKKGPYYIAIAHPYVTFDLVNDPQAGGFLDVAKQHPSSPDRERLQTLEDRGLIGRIRGVELWESTNVTKITGTPNKWRTYFGGKEGVLAIDLAGLGPRRVRDPKLQPFGVTVLRHGPDKADPEGVIAGSVSYNFKYVTKTADANRIKKIDAPSSIVS